MESQTGVEKTVVLQDEGLQKLKGFIQIPRLILLHKNISYGAKVAYGVLLGYAWQDDFCFPAQGALADDLGCSVRQAQRLLDELKKENLITCKRIGLNRPNIYYILPLSPQNNHINQANNKLRPLKPNKNKTRINPDTTNMSYPDTTNMSRQEATNMSHYLYSNNDTHTVNGGFVKGGKRREGIVDNLQPLDQPIEKTRYIADHILQQLKDKHSAPFYQLVASKVPESYILQALSEIKADGARNPPKLFTHKMKEYVLKKMKKGILKQMQ
jgi:hypothetical protein